MTADLIASLRLRMPPQHIDSIPAGDAKQKLNIGVDVAKDEVVVGCGGQVFAAHSVPNQRTALTAWLETLPKGSRIGMEATGCYHEMLADLAHRYGHTVFVLNPKDTRHYALAVGAVRQDGPLRRLADRAFGRP